MVVENDDSTIDSTDALKPAIALSERKSSHDLLAQQVKENGATTSKVLTEPLPTSLIQTA
jgi:hypothetical protein